MPNKVMKRMFSCDLLSLRENMPDSWSSRVERVLLTKGDGLGFDILSFDENGKDRLVEVKTTVYGLNTPFMSPQMK